MKNTIFILLVIGMNIISFAQQSNTKQLKEWKIQNSSIVGQNGKEISNDHYNDKTWIETNVPSTVFNSLVKNGTYKDIYKGKNLEKIDTKPFLTSWWYRTSFNIDDLDQIYSLSFKGINYSADIWLNGKRIGNRESIQSAYKIFNLDITDHVVEGKNILAVEIFPPGKTDLTIGFVDWNPPAPDKNMGIWRGVTLKKTKEVSLNNVFIRSKIDLETLQKADLIITTDLVNHSPKKISTIVNINIGEDIKISKEFSLNPNESKSIQFLSDEFSQLQLQNPKLWWTNNLGEPNLYDLNISATVGKTISDNEHIRFGIRDISEYTNQEGHKGYKLNGKKILIKGAGWVDDLLLGDTPEKVEAQLQYVKHMNMNTIRLEGFWGNDKTIYEKADELGILVMIGWSCHWEWEGYCNREELTKYMSITEPEDMQLHAEGYRDQVIWLRNHPSVFLWSYGSDKLPVPELERKLNNYLKEFDNTRPIVASCKYKDFDLKYNEKGEVIEGYINDSEVSGPTRVKMLGPYAYISPNYWYIDSIAGGAFGFNTETGPGPQVPPLESLKKMIPKDKLWPINDVWNFHNGRNEFQTLNRYIKAFNGRYGANNNVEDFAFKSQISNYEAIRAMFEAFAVNKYKATGVIQWMLNSAWPETFWQLYDWYMMPNGAFYGTKKACQPLSLIYNYGDNAIYINNEYNDQYSNLKAEISILNINSDILLKKEIPITIEERKSKKLFTIPELKGLSKTYFLSMKLIDKQGNKISSNFYWLSTKEDVLDFKNSTWFMTPIAEYADFTALNTMPKATVKVTHKVTDKSITVNIKNTSNKLAFFIDLQVKGSKSGESILPIFWDDNYLSLLPGEERQIKATFTINKKTDGDPVFTYKGFNLN